MIAAAVVALIVAAVVALIAVAVVALIGAAVVALIGADVVALIAAAAAKNVLVVPSLLLLLCNFAVAHIAVVVLTDVSAA